MCKALYNVQSRYDWALNQFGGWELPRDFEGYSNILFRLHLRTTTFSNITLVMVSLILGTVVVSYKTSLTLLLLILLKDQLITWT